MTGAESHTGSGDQEPPTKAHEEGNGASHEHPRFRYDNSYLIADPAGAVVLETAGRRHAVEEVRGARSISNGLTMPGFAERYADPLRGRVAQCSVRQARTGAAAQAADGVLDLVAALRDHGGNGSIAYRRANGALGAPCAHAGGVLTSTQTTASWVSNATTGEHWVTGTAAPCTSLFKPVALAPPPWPQPTGLSNGADPAHLWWRHERVHRGWTRDPQAYADTRRERDALEREWVATGTSPDEAWPLASAWEERGAAVVPSGDVRPALVRGLWRRWDRASRMAG